MKHKKHDSIVKDYGAQKSKHLDSLATKMLENEEKFRKLRSKEMNNKFLNIF